MFKICTTSKTILKSVKPPTFHFQTKGLSFKKQESPRKWIRKYFNPTIEDIEQLNLVTNDFKVVYINGNNTVLMFKMYLAYFMGGATIFHLSGYFRDPDWLEKEGPLGKFNLPLGIVLIMQTAAIYWLVTRNIKYIFRNGNDLKYIFYSFFRLSKIRVVDHKVNECEGPKHKRDLFHYLDKKKVIIIPECFIRPDEYMQILK